MSADSQMIVKTEEPGTYNLSVGEPHFLQEAFSKFLRFPSISLASFVYPPYGGEPALIERLQKIHPYKYIVITNGGKQGLLAAQYALSSPNAGIRYVSHRVPYWPSHPTLAKLSDLCFISSLMDAPVISINTSPNNPDGTCSNKACDIWDAAYAHPIYGFDGQAPEHKIAVFSGSKMYGMSGLRVGWVAMNDADLAEQCRHYVEITTSGVSAASQAYMISILDTLRAHPVETEQAYAYAKNLMETNGDLFMQYLASYCNEISGRPCNTGSMFAYFKVVEPKIFAAALIASKVKMVGGASCGTTEPGWYRMSLGHTEEYTRNALAVLNIELERLWSSI